jgi:hypothetical protein
LSAMGKSRTLAFTATDPRWWPLEAGREAR